MERKDKACWNCLHYKAYYTKGWCSFDKQNCGLCKKQKKSVEKHCVCDLWMTNYSLRTSRKEAVKNKLAEAVDIMVEIRQFLLDEKENKEK